MSGRRMVKKRGGSAQDVAQSAATLGSLLKKSHAISNILGAVGDERDAKIASTVGFGKRRRKKKGSGLFSRSKPKAPAGPVPKPKSNTKGNGRKRKSKRGGSFLGKVLGKVASVPAGVIIGGTIGGTQAISGLGKRGGRMVLRPSRGLTSPGIISTPSTAF